MTAVIDKTAALTEVKAWIEHILRRKNWTGTELARKSGIAPSTVLRMFSDKNYTFVASYSTIMKLASASGYKPPKKLLEAFGVSDDGIDTDFVSTTPERVLETVGAEAASEAPLHLRASGKVGNKNAVVSDEDRAATGTAEHQGTPPRNRADSIPILPVSRLPRNIQPICWSEKTADRPARLSEDRTAFAFSMPDDAMAPIIPVGSMMYATKSRSPAVGDLILVTKTDGRSIVRVVKDLNEDGFTLTKLGDDLMQVGFDLIEEVGVVVSLDRA